MNGPALATLRPVIVGYGHAGRDLHHRCLRSLARHGAVPPHEVIVVDPRLPADPLPGIHWYSTLSAALDALGDPRLGVFHVTAPVGEHVPLVTALLESGARQLVVEKPVSRTGEQVRRLAAAAASSAARLIPVSVWPASAVTRQVAELLSAGRIGTPVTLHMEQSKPRFRRSLDDCGHRSAFEVELPHQLLLALHLGGPVVEIMDVAGWAMPLPDRTMPRMGGARLRLRHRSGLVSTLRTDLTAPIRIRRLRITGTAGEIQADYPVSADDDFGQIRVAGETGRRVVPDAPLSRFLELTYAHLAGAAQPPPCGLAIHVTAIELLDTAVGRARSEHRDNLEVLPC